jgi:hypothetical protein
MARRCAWAETLTGSKQKYPLILNIHGGPHAAYGFIFSHNFNGWQRKVTWCYIQIRGSTSYGQEFGNIIQYHYPVTTIKIDGWRMKADPSRLHRRQVTGALAVVAAVY